MSNHTQVQLLVILNLQKDRNSPWQKGHRNPTQKAAKVGSRNSQTQRWMGRRIRLELREPAIRFWNRARI